MSKNYKLNFTSGSNNISVKEDGTEYQISKGNKNKLPQTYFFAK
jgi:hypothetical protein